MFKHHLTTKLVSAAIALSLAGLCISQQSSIVPDLSKIINEDGWKVFNRKARLVEENGNTHVYFEAQPGDGVAWLQGVEFTKGIIEVDIRGKDVQGRSFVGIAFHGVDDSTYEAVYFRPFNFKNDDPARRGHSVQYISHPAHPWYKLRNEHPEKYENPVNPAPEPEAFFHARIVVEKPEISVFVNDAKEPCLVVGELADRKGGWVGLWMGNNSDGRFKNLKITPAPK